MDPTRTCCPTAARIAPKPSCSGGSLHPGIWSRLPLDLALRVVSCLSPNEIAVTARPLCKAAAALFSSLEHRTIQLSQSVPTDAFLQHWSRPDAVRALSYKQRKQLLLLTAGSGGSPGNLVVALGAAGITPPACPTGDSVFAAAARSGSVEACGLLWTLECGVSKHWRGWVLLTMAAAAGQVALCKWIHHTLDIPWQGCMNSSADGTNTERYDAMSRAAEGGHLELCKLMHEEYGIPYTWAVALAAAQQGDVQLLQRVECADWPSSSWEKAFEVAATGGHSRVCLWLVAAGHIGPAKAVELAAKVGGPSALVMLLLDTQISGLHGLQTTDEMWPQVLEAAVRSCDLAGLKHLFQQAANSTGPNRKLVLPSDGAGPLILAAALNSPSEDWREKAEWLMAVHGLRLSGPGFDHRCELVGRRSAGEAPGAVLERLLFLRRRGLMGEDWLGGVQVVEELLTSQSVSAAELEAFLQAGFGDVTSAAAAAARHGRPELLLRLQSLGARITADMVARVAQGVGAVAPLEALLTALSPEVVLSREVTRGAVKSSSAELVAWLLERGCELDASDFSSAVETGSETMMELLADKDCPRPEARELYSIAARNGDLQTLRCLRGLGFTLGSIDGPLVQELMESVPLPVLRWMAEQQVPIARREALEFLGGEMRFWMDEDDRLQRYQWISNELPSGYPCIAEVLMVGSTGLAVDETAAELERATDAMGDLA